MIPQIDIVRYHAGFKRPYHIWGKENIHFTWQKFSNKILLACFCSTNIFPSEFI